MPIYEHRCPKCLVTREHLQSTYDPAPLACVCGAQMTLVFSPSAVVFKGKGWAKRDRRGGGQNPKR